MIPSLWQGDDYWETEAWVRTMLKAAASPQVVRWMVGMALSCMQEQVKKHCWLFHALSYQLWWGNSCTGSKCHAKARSLTPLVVKMRRVPWFMTKPSSFRRKFSQEQIDWHSVTGLLQIKAFWIMLPSAVCGCPEIIHVKWMSVLVWRGVLVLT